MERIPKHTAEPLTNQDVVSDPDIAICPGAAVFFKGLLESPLICLRLIVLVPIRVTVDLR
jgi:hypothetical protein